jgi:nicotinamidase-related amidase
VKRPKIEFKQSVLVVIDAQDEYRTGSLKLPNIENTIQKIKMLLDRARDKGIPVIHVLHEGTVGGLFDPRKRYFKSISELAPKSGEQIILKHLPDAFVGTSLENVLRKIGFEKTVVFVGFMTHMCITASATHALNLGFQNAVVTDAVGTRDLRGSDGKSIPAEEVNKSTLASLQDRMAWLVSVSELLKF